MNARPEWITNVPSLKSVSEAMQQVVFLMEQMPTDARVDALNKAREMLHRISPFASEPVDFVRWVKNDAVRANDYNPNKVAPPEMELLHISIQADGYTQPIVSMRDGNGVEVIDGFHRHRVGKERPDIRDRIHGYLPVVEIRSSQTDKKDRIASTIRHNRARGKHQIDAMSEIVVELKNRNWKNTRIARELGMDEEEVLRLCQISGMEYLFSDRDFSRAWEADDSIDDWEELTDELSPEEIEQHRIPHQGRKDRIFHTYDKWECHKAGFYAQDFEGKTAEECEEIYRSFLADTDRFSKAAFGVIENWKHSCEHYLTNIAMNRIAWIGQAAACYETGVPSRFCAGYNLLTEEQKRAANEVALEALNQWLESNGRQPIEMNEAMSVGRQVEIY